MESILYDWRLKGWLMRRMGKGWRKYFYVLAATGFRDFQSSAEIARRADLSVPRAVNLLRTLSAYGLVEAHSSRLKFRRKWVSIEDLH